MTITPLDWFLLAVGGIGAGLLGGTLGVGGALILVPIITHYLHIWGFAGEQLVQATLANSLSTVLFVGLSATWRQYKQGNFFFRQSLITALPGIATTLMLAWAISLSDWYTPERFTVFFLAVLLLLAWRMFSNPVAGAVCVTPPEISANWFALTGGLAGIVTALSGLGGGVVMVPVFNQWLKISLRQSISLSTSVIPFFALANMLWYLLQTPATYPAAGPAHWGYIIPGMALPMIAGVLVGAPQGVKLGQRLPQQTLRLLFIGMMLIVAGKMILDLI